MRLNNLTYCKELFAQSDLFICTLDFEPRSFFLFDKISSMMEGKDVIVFAMDDCQTEEGITERIEYMRANNIQVIAVGQGDSAIVQGIIMTAIKEKTSNQGKTSVIVDIDYSSMPRDWYCKLPFEIECELRDQDTVRFWYSEGDYPLSYEEYPTAGVESYRLFSGRSSLETQRKRVHVIGIGYDSIRTQGIISLLDPEYVVACEAYDPGYEGVHENVLGANEQLLTRTALQISFNVGDFKFIIAKLREFTNESITTADVIFVPDGPKPLIFAMSMIPQLIEKVGVTCLHVARNEEHIRKLGIKANGKVVGFSIQRSAK